MDAQGNPEARALALVFDGSGAPLPLPAHELIADARGELTVGRLGSGRWTLHVLSADAQRLGTRTLTLAAGEERELRVELRSDPSGITDLLGGLGRRAFLVEQR